MGAATCQAAKKIRDCGSRPAHIVAVIKLSGGFSGWMR
jgi:hypothetical protein